MQKTKFLAIFSLVALVILAAGYSRNTSYVTVAAASGEQTKSVAHGPQIKKQDLVTPCDVDFCLEAGKPVEFKIVECSNDKGLDVTCADLTPGNLPPGATYSTTSGNPAEGTFKWDNPTPVGLTFRLTFEPSLVNGCPPDFNCTETTVVKTIKVVESSECDQIRAQVSEIQKRINDIDKKDFPAAIEEVKTAKSDYDVNHAQLETQITLVKVLSHNPATPKQQLADAKALLKQLTAQDAQLKKVLADKIAEANSLKAERGELIGKLKALQPKLKNCNDLS